MNACYAWYAQRLTQLLDLGAMNNAFLNVVNGVVQGNPGPGQANITQEQYVQILLAQLTQIWTDYGELAEVWFDGGYPEGTEAPITALLQQLQPNAVAFQGSSVILPWCSLLNCR